MSKPANKTLIGAFVVAALVLLIAAIAIFGSGKFFAKKVTRVMYFQGSVKGLNIGSPVVVRGVKIGEVTSIRLIYDIEKIEALVEVIIETDPKTVTLTGVGAAPGMAELIKRGYRAQLQLQSFVTGQLMVGIDFWPESPANLYGYNKEFDEIPTIPTATEQLAKTLENLPLQEIVDNLNTAIAGIDNLVNSPDLRDSMKELKVTLKHVDGMVANINRNLVPSFTQTSDSARAAVTELTPELKAALESTRDAMGSARATMDEATATLSEIKDLSADTARLRYGINNSLEEFIALSRSLRALADYFQRHPEALLTGKTPEKGE